MLDRYTLAYLPYSNQIRTENAVKTLKYCFSYNEFNIKQNGVDCKLSKVRTSSQRHSGTQRFREQKHRQNDQSGPQRFMHYNVMYIARGLFEVF